MILKAGRLEKRGVNRFIAQKALQEIERSEYPLLDLSIGEPPAGPGQQICGTLFQESVKLENRFYADNGSIQFARTAENYFRDVYDCTDCILDFLPVMGAKSALSMIPAAYLNPGEFCIMPDPAYSVLGTWSSYLGGSVFNIPLKKENDYYPIFTDIPEDILRKIGLLYLNYPNNPTGQTATPGFFNSAVEFALKWNILIVHDCAYGEILRPEQKPLSIFSVPGAADCCIEIHSLSKIRNMTGWRIGFAVGKKKILEPLRIVKSNTDSGQFIPIQLAAGRALMDRKIIDRMNSLYTERLIKTAEILDKTGLEVKIPPGTFYLYIPVPEKEQDGTVFSSGDEFCGFLRGKAGISAIPWGSHFRFSVTFPEREHGDGWFFRELEKRLGGFRFHK